MMLTTRKQDLSTTYSSASTGEIRPLSLRSAVLLFAIPALLFLIASYRFIPFLEGNGIPPLYSMLAAFTVPLALLFTAALVGYFGIENRPPLRKAFADRMWFATLQRKDVLWGLGIFVFGMLAVGVFSTLERGLIDAGVISLPAHIPLLLDPRAALTPDSLAKAAGGPLAGQWGLALLYLVYLFFNIAGEELWWRGYILPRQVARHGRFAWILHALMWTAFHAFKWWNLTSVLPLALMMAYVSQRTRSNWPALLSHLLGNSVFFVILLAGIIAG